MPPLLLTALLLAAACAGPRRTGPGALVDQKAPSWSGLSWFDPKTSMDLGDLKGRVVVMNWWTEGCIPCVNNATALNEMHNRYQTQGVTVVGFYYPAQPGPIQKEGIRQASQILGISYPVALDPKWKTFRKYWPSGGSGLTRTPTFVVDAKGVVRAIHAAAMLTTEDAVRMEKLVRDLIEEARRDAAARQ